MTAITVSGEPFSLTVMTLADTPREQLDSEAAAVYGIFAEREREFGFGSDIVVDYPPVGMRSSLKF